MKNFIVGALIIGIGIVVGFVVVANIIANRPMGASSGPEHYNTEYFYGGMVQGGGIKIIVATTTAVQLTAGEICEYSILDIVPVASSAATAITTPTAAAINNRCLPQDGMFKDFVIWDHSKYASTTFTFATGTGMTLFSGDAIIAGKNRAEIRVQRTAASTTDIYVTEGATN